MKVYLSVIVRERSKYSFRRHLFWALVVWLIIWQADTSIALPLTGSNGKVVEFAGVKSASPDGLEVKVSELDSATIVVPWDKLDILKLKEDYPNIHIAYENALSKRTITEINLGIFSSKISMTDNPKILTTEMINKVPGRYSASSGTGAFTLQLPQGGKARAILLLSMGDDGNSERYIGRPERSRWKNMVDKHSLAVMAYRFPMSANARGGEPFTKAAPHAFAGQGSGEALLKALKSMAGTANRPELADLPFIVYGQGVPGAAFAYNFTQAFPDRVIASVVAKGAFYIGERSESSAKVPMLLVEGEYDQDINLWKPTDTLRETYEASLGLKPNWIYALEFRAGPGETQELIHFGMTFLDRMLLVRLSAEGELVDLDLSRAWIGDLKAFTPERAEEDAEAVLTADQTWLPDGEIAKMWEEFCNGNLKVPANQTPQ